MEWIKEFYEILKEYTKLRLKDIKQEGDLIYIEDNLEEGLVKWEVYNLDKFINFKLNQCKKYNISLDRGINKVLEVYKNSFENIKKEAFIGEIGKLYYYKEVLERIDIKLKNIAREGKSKVDVECIETFTRNRFSIGDFFKEGDLAIIRWGQNEVKLDRYKRAILDMKALINSDKEFSIIILEKQDINRGIEIRGEWGKLKIFEVYYREETENIVYEKRTKD